MTLTFKKAPDSTKSAHQQVVIDGRVVGEVWREEVSVVVSKLTQPRRMGLKWRWFSKTTGSPTIFGRGTRAAMLLGPGFKTKGDAVAALNLA